MSNRIIKKYVTFLLLFVIFFSLFISADYEVAHLHDLVNTQSDKENHECTIEQISLPLIAALPSDSDPVHNQNSLHGGCLLKVKAGSSFRSRISLIGLLVAVFVILFLRFSCYQSKDINLSIYYVYKRVIKYIHSKDGEKDNSAYRTCPIIK